MDDFIDWLEVADIERKRERENFVDNRLLNKEATKVAAWLKDNGYDSLVEWGLDSDYYMNEHGVWFNEDGVMVDIFHSAYYAMEAANEGV